MPSASPSALGALSREQAAKARRRDGRRPPASPERTQRHFPVCPASSSVADRMLRPQRGAASRPVGARATGQGSCDRCLRSSVHRPDRIPSEYLTPWAHVMFLVPLAADNWHMPFPTRGICPATTPAKCAHKRVRNASPTRTPQPLIQPGPRPGRSGPPKPGNMTANLRSYTPPQDTFAMPAGGVCHLRT